MIDWDNLPQRKPPKLTEDEHIDPAEFVLYMAGGYNGLVFLQLLDVPGQPVDALDDAWVTLAVDQPEQAILYWRRPRGDEGCLYLAINRIDDDDTVYAESPVYGRLTLQQAMRYVSREECKL